MDQWLKVLVVVFPEDPGSISSTKWGSIVISKYSFRTQDALLASKGTGHIVGVKLQAKHPYNKIN